MLPCQNFCARLHKGGLGCSFLAIRGRALQHLVIPGVSGWLLRPCTAHKVFSSMATMLQRAGRAAARMPAHFTQLWDKPQVVERAPSMVFMGPPGVGKGGLAPPSCRLLLNLWRGTLAGWLAWAGLDSLCGVSRCAQACGLAKRIVAAWRQVGLSLSSPAGTYCGKLADALGIAHIATGDLVREEIDKRTDIGLQVWWLSCYCLCRLHLRTPSQAAAGNLQAQANVLNGNLLPDSTIFQVSRAHLLCPSCQASA